MVDRTLKSGRTSRLVVSFSGTSWLVSTTPGAPKEVVAPDLVTVVAGTPSLNRLPLGELRSYSADSSRLSLLDLVPVLRGTGVHESEGEDEDWESEAAASFVEQDELLDEVCPDIPFIHRWASYNGRRLTGVARGRGIEIVALDLDEEGLEQLDLIAEGRWFSEGGGAPTSWDGGSALSRVSRHLCVSRSWGDVQAGTEVFEWPASRPKQLGVLADWVQSAGFEAAAALDLEPLDPRGTLSASRRTYWLEQIDALTMDVSVPGELAEDLRRRLFRQSSTYAAVTRALRSPRGKVGHRFLEALESSAQDGVIGEVTFFE